MTDPGTPTAAGGPAGDAVGETDESLMSRAQAGDRDALAALLERFRPRVWSVCRRMTGVGPAEDLTQDTLVNVVRGIDTFGGGSAVSTWVIRVAMNVCLSYLRREGVRKAERAGTGGAADAGGLEGREPGVGSGVEQTEELTRVARALSRLDDGQRAVLVLRDVQGLDYGHIAEVLGIKRGTVKSRISRAREALRAEIGGGGPKEADSDG